MRKQFKQLWNLIFLFKYLILLSDMLFLYFSNYLFIILLWMLGVLTVVNNIGWINNFNRYLDRKI